MRARLWPRHVPGRGGQDVRGDGCRHLTVSQQEARRRVLLRAHVRGFPERCEGIGRPYRGWDLRLQLGGVPHLLPDQAERSSRIRLQGADRGVSFEMPLRSHSDVIAVVEQLLGVSRVSSELLASVFRDVPVRPGHAVHPVHHMGDADIHRERLEMTVSEQGHAVGHLRTDTVDADQLLDAAAVIHLSYPFGVDLPVLDASRQFDEALLAESEPASADEIRSVQDLLRGGERMPSAKVPSEGIAHGFDHLPDPGDVRIRREEVCREAFPLVLLQDAEAGAALRQRGHARIPLGDLGDDGLQVVPGAHVIQDPRFAPASLDVHAVLRLPQADDLVPEDALPDIAGLPPTVRLSASQGGIEGDVELQLHACPYRQYRIISRSHSTMHEIRTCGISRCRKDAGGRVGIHPQHRVGRPRGRVRPRRPHQAGARPRGRGQGEGARHQAELPRALFHKLQLGQPRDPREEHRMGDEHRPCGSQSRCVHHRDPCRILREIPRDGHRFGRRRAVEMQGHARRRGHKGCDPRRGDHGEARSVRHSEGDRTGHGFGGRGPSRSGCRPCPCPRTRMPQDRGRHEGSDRRVLLPLRTDRPFPHQLHQIRGEGRDLPPPAGCQGARHGHAGTRPPGFQAGLHVHQRIAADREGCGGLQGPLPAIQEGLRGFTRPSIGPSYSLNRSNQSHLSLPLWLSGRAAVS